MSFSIKQKRHINMNQHLNFNYFIGNKMFIFPFFYAGDLDRHYTNYKFNIHFPLFMPPTSCNIICTISNIANDPTIVCIITAIILFVSANVTFSELLQWSSECCHFSCIPITHLLKKSCVRLHCRSHS